MINILCFGDSNTNGSNPVGGRWGRWERWTGVLQKLLGDDYYVIEEGCGGRTTVMEDWLEPDKNGRAQLPVALRTHRPLDLVVIMLGTNDMKKRFSLLPVDIAYGAAELGKLVESYDYGGAWYPVPQVLLVSPIELGEGVENSPFTGFAPEAVEISKAARPVLRGSGKGARLALFQCRHRRKAEQEGYAPHGKRGSSGAGRSAGGTDTRNI